MVFGGEKQLNQAKYTIVTSSFRTYVKRPRSLSESIVVAGGDFLEVDFFYRTTRRGATLVATSTWRVRCP